MGEEQFWKIIEDTASPNNDAYERLESLRSALQELSLDEVVGFEKSFRRLLNKAYTWDLWGAAYVILGGCSDDGFEYFRR